VIAPTVLGLATLLSLGPHLLMLGYHVAGASPPAELVLFCPLHHLADAHRASTWTLRARPLA